MLDERRAEVRGQAGTPPTPGRAKGCGLNGAGQLPYRAGDAEGLGDEANRLCPIERKESRKK